MQADTRWPRSWVTLLISFFRSMTRLNSDRWTDWPSDRHTETGRQRQTERDRKTDASTHTNTCRHQHTNYLPGARVRELRSKEIETAHLSQDHIMCARIFARISVLCVHVVSKMYVHVVCECKCWNLHTATQCNTLHHTASHCKTMHATVTHWWNHPQTTGPSVVRTY